MSADPRSGHRNGRPGDHFGAQNDAVVAVSVTARGRAMAERLPFEAVHGSAAETVRSRWTGCAGFVLFLATGAAVRIVAPLLEGKDRDPAVVCVDESGRFAVALCGGHEGGANDLARRVAATLGAEPVITTATDAAGIPALDQVPGWVVTGDVAGVSTALLDGRAPRIDNLVGWPLPNDFPSRGTGPERIEVTDRVRDAEPGLVVAHPPSLVAGVGASTDAPADEVRDLLDGTLAAAGLAPVCVGEVATIDRRAGDRAVVNLGLPVRSFTAAQLAAVDVPSPSSVVRAAVGTASVAEAAALLAAGPGGELVVTKQASPHATVAVARRRGPRGHLSVVGAGPGGADCRTPAAERSVRRADVVVGYGPYLDQCRDLLSARQEIVSSPIGDERLRAKQAVAEAVAGRRVALVSSGDAGVYGMAAVTLELLEEDGQDIDVEVVPGVTAALAAAALLGAPLGHDHALISLSDLLTPWEAIESRLRAAATSDLVVALFNPRSKRRTWQLDAARRILSAERPGTTPVGVVTDAWRPGQRVELTTLEALATAEVGMTTCLIVGSSTTRVVGGRMVTPRGAQP
jgi:cobalt-precorrin 5A hydrolase/precorrin-3B C17-methyltransferase